MPDKEVRAPDRQEVPAPRIFIRIGRVPEVGLSPVIIGHSNQLSVDLHAGATQPTQDPEPPCDEKGDQREEDQRNEASPSKRSHSRGATNSTRPAITVSSGAP